MENSTDIQQNAPRCIECGYILLGLIELRCPECGTEFDSEYVKQDSYRVHLLPWERPELGGSVKRLARTFIGASLHPSRFYTSVKQRKERRIQNPVKLMVAYIFTSVCFLVASYLVSEVMSFAWLWAKVGQVSQAWYIAQRTFSVTWNTSLFMAVEFILSLILPVGVMAVLISRNFREKIGSLRSVDLVAFHGYTVAMPVLLMSVAVVLTAAMQDMAIVFFTISIVAMNIILLQAMWFCCRNLLLLSRWGSVGMLIAGSFVYIVCGEAISWLAQIPFLISHGLL